MKKTKVCANAIKKGKTLTCPLEKGGKCVGKNCIDYGLVGFKKV